MHAADVVVQLDVLEYVLLRLLPGLVAAPVDELPLERLEERLGDGVVVRVAGARH